MNADNGVNDGATGCCARASDASLADVIGLSGADELGDHVPTVESFDVVLPADAEPPERLSSVLVAVGSGPHSGATVDFAKALAEASDAWLELFHVAEERSTASGESLLSAARDRLGAFDRVDHWLVEDETPAAAIVEQSAYYNTVVLGAPTSGRVERFVLGSTTGTVLEHARSPVLVVTADGSTPLSSE